jgi:hypothetical protein
MCSYRFLLSSLIVLLISACDSGSSSRNGNTHNAITPPSDLSVAEVASESVTLAWNGVTGAQSYRLYYASEPIVSVNNIHAHASGDWIAEVNSGRWSILLGLILAGV